MFPPLLIPETIKWGRWERMAFTRPELDSLLMLADYVIERHK